MITGCRAWTCRRNYFGLEGASSIDCANNEMMNARLLRVPLIAPLNPRHRRASVHYFGRIPGSATVRAHFHAPNSPSATKRNAVKVDRRSQIERLVGIEPVKS